MTGQQGGFRAAMARFSAEVEAALTRARRAASEARAQSADFRKSSNELAEQAKTGRLRGVHRDQVERTTPQAHDAAVKFRHANGLTVEQLPDAGTLIARLPAAEPERAREDDDFSQHAVLIDVDDHSDVHSDVHGDVHGDEHGAPVRQAPVAEREPPGIDSPRPRPAAPEADEDDFSQQRILFDVTAETYRPDTFPDSVLDQPDGQNRS